METKAILGCLLGTAVGDAIGLPCEGLSRRRIWALFGGVPDGHRLFFGRGMVSDDTEHTLLVADALTASAGDPERFERELARGLRRWLLLLPAGVGFATLRACGRLLLGIPPSRSGVLSAGNGPAMRAALLGVVARDDAHLRELVHRCTRLTHTDPKAEYGAHAVALAARHFAWSTTDATTIVAAIGGALPDTLPANELRDLLQRVAESVRQGETTPGFAAHRLQLPERVSGYVYHTVPVALHAALTHPGDFRQAVLSALACGGDTDTVAAIVGGIVGANVGEKGIPDAWVNGLAEWPRGVGAIRTEVAPLATAMAAGTAGRTTIPPWPAVLPRNLLFALIVIGHGLRRLLPPY